MRIQASIKFLFILILFSCNSKTDNSFKMLVDAFLQWYQRNHLIDINFTNNNYHYFAHLNNEELFYEYKEDLNRFELELSQIDQIKLNFNNRVNYNIVSDFINHAIYINENKNNKFLHLDIFIYRVYYSLYNILEDRTITMDDKIDELFFIIPDITKNINQIDNDLYSNKELLDQSFSALLKYLDQIPIKVNSSNEVLDSLDNELKFLKTTLINFKKTKYEKVYNIKDYDIYNNNSRYNYYVNNLLNKKYNFDELKKDYKYYQIKLLDECLIIFNQFNDEPIWIDESDTLKVIKWVVDKKINVSNVKKENVINEYYKSLNHIYSFSETSNFNILTDNNLSFINKNSDIHLFDKIYNYSFGDAILDISKKPYYNKYYINNNLVKFILIDYLFKDQSFNNKLRYLFVDKSFIFALSNTFNGIYLKDSKFKEDKLFLILHYLDLLREINKSENQNNYFIRKVSKKDIVKNLKKYSLFNINQAEDVYDDMITLKEIYIKNYLYFKELNNHNRDNNLLRSLLEEGQMPDYLFKHF